MTIGPPAYAGGGDRFVVAVTYGYSALHHHPGSEEGCEAMVLDRLDCHRVVVSWSTETDVPARIPNRGGGRRAFCVSRAETACARLNADHELVRERVA